MSHRCSSIEEGNVARIRWTREAAGLIALSAISASDYPVYCTAWLATNPIRRYSPAQIGMIDSIEECMKTLLMPILGKIVDSSLHKRFLLALGSLCFGIYFIVLVSLPQFLYAQAAIKVVSAVGLDLVPLSINAITLGTTSDRHFSSQIAANKAAEHIGICVGCFLIGTLAFLKPALPLWSVVPSGSAFATACSVVCLRADRIDHARAAGRNSTTDIADAGEMIASSHACGALSGGLAKLMQRRVFWQWMLVAFLFNVANMPQTQLLAQYAAHALPEGSVIPFTSCCMIIAHAFMAVASGLAGHFLGICDEKRLLLVGAAVVTVRASVLTVMVTSGLSPWLVLIPSQILDGFGIGFWHPTSVLIVQHISAGEGCFSQLMGCTLGAFCFGAVVSSIIAGLIATAGGWAASFGYLVVMAFTAIATVAMLPETHGMESGSSDDSSLATLTSSE